jgi:hypothetical protein
MFLRCRDTEYHIHPHAGHHPSSPRTGLCPSPSLTPEARVTQAGLESTAVDCHLVGHNSKEQGTKDGRGAQRPDPVHQRMDQPLLAGLTVLFWFGYSSSSSVPNLFRRCRCLIYRHGETLDNYLWDAGLFLVYSEQIVFFIIKTFCVNFCSQKPLLPAFESAEMCNVYVF